MFGRASASRPPPTGQDDARMMVPPATMCGKSQDDARMRGQDDTQDEIKKKSQVFAYFCDDLGSLSQDEARMKASWWLGAKPSEATPRMTPGYGPG